MKIKEFTVKEERQISPIDLAVLTAMNNTVDTAVFFIFGIDEDENGDEFIYAKRKELVCRMHNVRQDAVGVFASNVMKHFYKDMLFQWRAVRDKESESLGVGNESKETLTILDCYDQIVRRLGNWNYETAPTFERVCASCFSGRWVSCTDPIKIIRGFEDQKNKDEMKAIIDEFLAGVSEKTDTATVRKYWFRCSNTLYEDVKSSYYKGRKIAKGLVKKAFDGKGHAVRREIILAMVEAMQAKLRSSSFGFEFKQENKQEQQEQQEQKQEQKQEHDKAGKKTLKTMFRELSKKFRPDNKESGNADIFKQINDANSKKDIKAMRDLYNKYM